MNIKKIIKMSLSASFIVIGFGLLSAESSAEEEDPVLTGKKCGRVLHFEPKASKPTFYKVKCS